MPTIPLSTARTSALDDLLTLYFSDDEFDLGVRSPRYDGLPRSTVGEDPPAPHLIARADVGLALQRLAVERPDLYLYVDLYYAKRYSLHDCARRLRHDESTVRQRLGQAKGFLRPLIWEERK